MSIYYISSPTTISPVNKEINTSKEVFDIIESSAIDNLKINRDATLASEVEAIREILTDEARTTEERSDAYQALKELNSTKSKEDALEATLKENFNYDAFVKIDASNVKVVLDTKDHSYELANKIIKTVQAEFKDNVYITVNFGSV